MWLGCGDAAEVAVAQAVAVAFEGDDVGVVDESVDHGGGHDVVAEDFSPAAELLVAGDDHAGSFVSGGDELEEQVRRFGFEGDVLGRGRDAVQRFRCRFSRPRPPNRTCALSPHPALHVSGGSGEEFADLADEGDIVVVGPAETCSGRVDLVDVVGRADLRAAEAVALDPHLRRVVEDVVRPR